MTALPPPPTGHSWLRVAMPVPDTLDPDRVDEYAEMYAAAARAELNRKAAG